MSTKEQTITSENPNLPGPDPSVLTTEQMLLAISNLEKQTTEARTGVSGIMDVRLESIRREKDLEAAHQLHIQKITEDHRLELKADNQRTVETAMIAAEKAVQAALAAAEKARDQQTIASQLATTKAEEASKEQMKQQGETFTLAITGLTIGLNDMKSLTGEMRAESRGGKEYQKAIYAFVGFLVSLVALGGFFVAITGYK